MLIRKGGMTGRCYCGEVQGNLHLYDKMEDNSNLFHTVAEEVMESILKEVCTTRYKGNSGFTATVGGDAYELSFVDGGPSGSSPEDSQTSASPTTPRRASLGP